MDVSTVSQDPICRTKIWHFSFFCHYSTWWTLTFTAVSLHCCQSCFLRLQFATPIFFRSSSADSSLGFPTRWLPSGLRRMSLLHGSSSCILNRRPSDISLLVLLMSYIYGASCKARNFNFVYIYIWTYFCQRWKPSLSICCTMFQHWINAESFPVSQLCVNTLPTTKITLITNWI
jgi:hypothetical protein